MIYNLVFHFREWLTSHGFGNVLQLLNWQTFRALAALGLSFLIVVVFGKPFARMLTRLRIGDAARFDVESLDRTLASKQNTPTMGGALIAAAIALSTFLLADITSSYVQMALLALLWMAVVGGADDWLKLTAARREEGSRQGLYAWEKLVFQLGLGALLGYFTYRAGMSDQGDSLAHALNIPFQRTYDPVTKEPSASLIYLGAPIFIVLSTLMVAGMANAVNITDGMDGLASGVTAFVGLGLMVLAVIGGWELSAKYLLVPHVAEGGELAIVAGAMAGACLGFLWWNCSPALMFMGDTGSQPLGALLAYIAVALRQEVLLLVMSGVFLIEVASVALQVGWFKSTKGKRIFRCAPYHWHLHMGGWAEQKVVARLWIVTLMLVVLALATIKVR